MRMNLLNKMFFAAAKITLVFSFMLLVGSSEVSAQKGKASAARKFVGNPELKKEAFKSFIIKNIGKRVYLKLTFDEDLMGYKESYADPFFSVDNYNYFFLCGEKANAHWTSRCGVLNYDDDAKTFAGYFVITEPSPRTMRTNRMFDLTPTK